MSTRMPPGRSPESAPVVGSRRTERTSNLGYGYSGFSVEMLHVLARVQLKTVRAPTLRVFWVVGRRIGNFLIRMKLLGVGHPLNLGFHLPGVGHLLNLTSKTPIWGSPSPRNGFLRRGKNRSERETFVGFQV
ncbi:hypothetical protein ACFX11_023187 [Malus domestica]